MAVNVEYIPMDKDIKQDIKSDSDEAQETHVRHKGLKWRLQNFMHIGNIFQSFIGSSILTLPFYNMLVTSLGGPVDRAGRLYNYRYASLLLFAPALESRRWN